MRLAGKTALITGSARGIGLEFARAYIAEGATVALADINAEAVAKAAAALGPKAIGVQMDVTSQASIDAGFASAIAQMGGLDILVNNAALFTASPIAEITRADYDRLFAVNVSGTLFCMQAAAKHMIARGKGGKIINMASQAGRRGEGLVAVYCATKFAVRAISDALRFDLKGTGVRVTNIEPGMVKTEFSKVRLGNQHKADAVYADMMPLSAMDIANTVLWCLSQPMHVNISELMIYPTDQASVGHVVRGEKSVKNFI